MPHKKSSHSNAVAHQAPETNAMERDVAIDSPLRNAGIPAYGNEPELEHGVADAPDTAPSEEEVLDFMRMEPKDVAKYMYHYGVDKNIAAKFIEQRINGKLAVSLEEHHLEEMGIDVIGERLKVLEVLKRLESGERLAKRNLVVWEGLEFRQHTVGPAIPCCPYQFPCCCVIGPKNQIKLTNANLQVTAIQKRGLWEHLFYNVFCCCCFTPNVVTDNIDVSDIQDINRIQIGKSCFVEEHVEIEIKAAKQIPNETEVDPEKDHQQMDPENTITINFSDEDGPVFERKLRNAMEEVQHLEFVKLIE